MAAAYRVRSARAADLELIVEFNRALARETEEHDLDEGTIVAGVTALLHDAAKGRYFIAELAEPPAPAEETGATPRAPVPAGQLMVTTEWSDWRNGPIWWVQSVYVDPSHRRRGVYRLLHDHLREAGREEGVVGLRLYVDRENRAGQDTYEALGMQPSRYLMYEEIWE